MKYQCPLCEAELLVRIGSCLYPLDPKHGLYLYCPNIACPAQEVAGHAKNVEDAYEIIQQKYKFV